MAVIGVSNFTVAIDKRGLRRVQGKKESEGLLTLTGGADTYATGGVALPAKDKFGFLREMTSLVLVEQGAPANSYGTAYVKTAHKLQLFVSHDTAGVTALPMDEEAAAALDAPTTRTWRFVALGW